MVKKREVSKRAERCWQRLTEWYGVRLTESYGVLMPPDWCEIVDRVDNPTIVRGLITIRTKYVAHPPTLPQFEQAMAPVKSATGKHEPNISELLCEYVMKIYGNRLTAKQLRGPWHYIGKKFAAQDHTGKTVEGHGIEITGVVIDADGDAPGYRVMVEDMQAEQAA